MYVQRAAPLPLSDFWSDLFSSAPAAVLSSRQQTIAASWPTAAANYRTKELLPFLDRITAEAAAAGQKAGTILSRKSYDVLGVQVGPSPELLSKLDGLQVELAKLAIKMGKRAQFAKAKAAEGYQAVNFPDLRADAVRLMALTNTIDGLVTAEGAPGVFSAALTAVVEGFTATGAWLVQVGTKIAKSAWALISNVDIVLWGGAALVGLYLWKRRG